MNKRKLILVLCVALLGILAIDLARVWVWPFNYYYEYNLLKRTLAEARCDIEHETVNHDVTLEEIDFTIRTQAGWKLDLFFPDERDMRQLCDHPKGLLLPHPDGSWQVYTIEDLSGMLKGDGPPLKRVGDILNNLDAVVPVLRANYENADVRRASKWSAELSRFLIVDAPWKPATTEANKFIEAQSTATDLRSEQGRNGLPLRSAGFEVVTLDSSGGVAGRRKGHALFYVEDLGAGVTLTMLKIPGGHFLMGTSFEEATVVQGNYVRYTHEDYAEFWHEGPPHTVTVSSFYMGRFEVTQAQWRAVASLPRANVELPDDPSDFKDDNRPVENISWQQAVEFCDRLSLASGRHYRLPTEAEWEYACRAGTSTPYYFGDAITSEYSNYKGIEPYGSVGWGAFLGETAPVGMYGAPNAFGLYDMHGNVDELCADPWHETYNSAPSDARVWTEGGNSYIHVVRGGGLYSRPADLRAASRGRCYNPANPCYKDGFRVVADAPSR
jgi:formylglycine-generating enzyme required for sulfatase activity